MDLVVNEWLPEYFLPTASPNEKRLLRLFIQRVQEGKYRLVVLLPSPFTKKLEDYAKRCVNNREAFAAIKYFIGIILQNPAHTTIISQADPLPAETLAILHTPGTNYSSDEYLFHAAMRTETKIILTTDEKLFRAMEHDSLFKVTLLRDFLD